MQSREGRAQQFHAALNLAAHHQDFALEAEADRLKWF
jgi:hypothetical protein